jgi:excisionase family DNA binding protein
MTAIRVPLFRSVPQPEHSVAPLSNIRLHTREEAAHLLRRSVRTIDKWTKEGKLPFVRFGRSILYTEDDLLSLVQEHTSRRS